MKYTKLGNSELNVSRICMGCMGFGDNQRGQHSWTIDEKHSREIIKRGLELGVNFYDTAIAYQSGTSEQYVGRALKDFTAKREDFVIATKFLPRTQDEINSGVTGQQHIENKHVEDAAKAANIVLSADEIKTIEKIAANADINVIRYWEKEMK